MEQEALQLLEQAEGFLAQLPIEGIAAAGIALLIAAIGFGIRNFHKLRKLRKECGKVAEVTEQYENARRLLKISEEQLEENKTTTQQLEQQAQSKRDENQRLTSELAIAQEKVTAAQQQAVDAATLATKDLELEAEKRRAEFEKKLEEEFLQLQATHPKAALEQMLATLNAEIDMARQNLLVQQESAQAQAKEEDYTSFHSISLSDNDKKDIALIREFAPRLTRQEAFTKLIWSEFYQKPLQALRKQLGADKVRGIYKITCCKTQRMYIGQAVDIGTRWADHVKAGLGIGSLSYMTNKFYKALHQEGAENFTFEVLETQPESLTDKETYWIEFYNASTFGYNSKIGG
jgi:hypothetical protein